MHGVVAPDAAAEPGSEPLRQRQPGLARGALLVSRLVTNEEISGLLDRMGQVEFYT